MQRRRHFTPLALLVGRWSALPLTIGYNNRIPKLNIYLIFVLGSQFNNNCHTDAIVVSATNVFTAIFAGFAVFSVMGFMAYNLDVPVDNVVQNGPGLAFIAYPEAVLLMPWPHFWAVSFFVMMFILGMGSQFGGIEAICTAVIDQWPHLQNHHWKVRVRFTKLRQY